MVQCELAIKIGLIKGSYQEVGEGKEKYAEVTITEESFGFARVGDFKNFKALCEIYRTIYPDSELPLPKEVQEDPIAFSYFMHGRFNKWRENIQHQ